MNTLSIRSAIIITAAALVLASCGRSGGSHEHAADTTQAQAAAEDYYTCPMHPQVHSDKPGSCPICHMDLVKASSLAPKEAGAVPLNERSQSLANVAVAPVRREQIERRVQAFGTLEIPEPNRTIISARFSGRIEKLRVSSVGTQVRKGQPLFDIYSPDIVQAQNDYMQAYKRPSSGSERAALLTAMRSKLVLLGFTDAQVATLESEEAAPLVFTYVSPASGIVIDKKIVEGMYVSEGLPLFEISDLSTLWNIADVYETDAAGIRTGEKAVISLQNGTGREYPATVSFIYPVVNPQSRTVKVRLTVGNAGGALKPNMYTQTIFTGRRGMALTVPVTAVLQTGKRNIVYVKPEGTDKFEPREVTLGAKFDGKFEITSGLREGETVVTEGGYLIDSESQLKSGTM